MVTKKDLEQLRGLNFEIKQLSNMRPKSKEVVIFYKDYRTGKGIPKTDIGFDDGSNEANELRDLLSKKTRKLIRKAAEVEKWLDTITDPLDRVIVRAYYIEGKTQQEIGDAVGYSRERIAKKLKIFWLKHEQDQKDQNK